MKRNLYKIHLLALLAIALFAACEKNTVPSITRDYNGAQFKFYNFAINAPSVNFYANGVKSTATLSASGTEAPTGVAFGSLLPTRGYVLITSGSGVVFKAITPSTMPVAAATGQGPSIEIASLTKDVVEGKNYTLYTSGIYDYTTKKCDAFIVEDVLPAIDTTQAYIRLVNPGHTTSTISLELTQTIAATPTTPAQTIVTTPITGVPYKGASVFVPVKQGSYSLRVIDATTNKVVTRAATSFIKERIYTFSLRGNLISGTPAPFLDFTENR